VSLNPAPEPAAEVGPGIAAAGLLSQPVVAESQLREHGMAVELRTFAGAGGGMGTFVWTDLLRVSGVPAGQIAVAGTEPAPYARYQRLCLNSQIPPHERLRSNSESCPDNVWGFPGYATREIAANIRAGNLREASRLAWQILGEPALSQTYTPRSGDVFHALDREAQRIGWQSMFRYGRIRAIRKSAEGRLLLIVSSGTPERPEHRAIASNFLHLAMGYPAIQLLPDLAEYREQHDDRRRVVNAYEDHGHIYEHLRQKGGTVVLRGRGIVASRIIQRLYEERRNNPRILVVHLHRSRLTAGHTYGRSRRGIENEFEFQPFNWPKGCWTGEQRVTLESAGSTQRRQLLDEWGGTTTADRRDWRRIVREGLREGWYRPEYGVVKEMSPTPDGRVASRISNSLAGGGTLDLVANYVIDCTGLVASPDRSPVIDDMMRLYGLERNPLGRLQVNDDFEVPGMRHGLAQMYASGAITLGGPHAAVDSFLGLQYAAFRAVESMRHANPGVIRKLGGLYSAMQWWRWQRSLAP
jgi:pSer/pThr/pTyr-binding forkhead associated (FHA) protein